MQSGIHFHQFQKVKLFQFLSLVLLTKCQFIQLESGKRRATQNHIIVIKVSYFWLKKALGFMTFQKMPMRGKGDKTQGENETCTYVLGMPFPATFCERKSGLAK